MKTNIKLLGKQLNSFLFISFLTFTILILSGFQLSAKTTTYSTIKDGNWNSSSTWQGGNIPPSDISHDMTVYIRHTINYNINKNLKNDGLIHIEPIAGTTAKLIIDNGKKVENKNNGEIKIINGALLQYRFHGGGNSGTHNNGDFKSDGDLTVQNGILEVSKNYDSKGDGTKTFIGSCIKVGENYSVDKNNTKEIYEDTYISIGWHGNGNFKLVKGTMEFKEQTVIQLAGTSGDFLLNNGHAYGDINFITLKNDVTGQTGSGKIKANNPLNTSPSLNLDAYWADTYTPNGKFSGPQTKIDITASYFPTDCTPGGNNSPIAANDTYSTDMNVTLSGNVLTNDSDPDGNTITVKTTPVTAPLHGSLTLNSDGTFTYTPTTSYIGTDIFVYEIFDNGTPSLTDQATVTVTVNSLNNSPVAVDDAFSTNMNQTLSGNIITNDSDPDGDNISVIILPVTPPSHGFLTLIADGTYTYLPTTGYTGTDTFVYKITDDGLPPLTDQATVTITINAPGNNPPIAVDDAFSTTMNVAVSGNILTNDSDPDGDNITLNTTVVTPPSHGTLILNTDSTFTFTPANNYVGTDSFVYAIYDDGTPSKTDQATVTITINAVNNPPLAVDDDYSENMNVAISGNVLTNDSDPDGDNITVNTTVVTPPSHGTLTLNANGTFTYTPETDYTGPDSFVYEISDDGTPSLTDQATVTITIFTPGGDDDGDGVPNGEDDYPDDGNRAFDNYYPAAGYGTLAYEDLWPGTGDYDFNDLVCDYRFKMVTNSSNKVVDIQGSFIVRAIGATLKNGFGFQLPNDNVANSDITVTGYDIQESYINLNANGTEAGQTNPTIIVYDNCFNILEHPGAGIGVNTTPSAPYVQPDTLNITMNITSDKYTLAEIDIPNFNPFLIVNQERGKEIHLPDYPPTDLVDETYFGTHQDDSNAATGKYYKTENNLPWAINIYESFDYPKEKVEIINTYNHFVEWAESNGSSYSDWYKDKSGYRNANNIYQIPSK